PPIVDPPTGQYTPGRWVWADLVTADVAAAADFYRQVFGWTFETYGAEDDRDTYTGLLYLDALPCGAIGVFSCPNPLDPTASWMPNPNMPQGGYRVTGYRRPIPSDPRRAHGRGSGRRSRRLSRGGRPHPRLRGRKPRRVALVSRAFASDGSRYASVEDSWPASPSSRPA
nr:hypothetical protein [Vicinamibacterales bacterium]